MLVDRLALLLGEVSLLFSSEIALLDLSACFLFSYILLVETEAISVELLFRSDVADGCQKAVIDITLGPYLVSIKLLLQSLSVLL